MGKHNADQQHTEINMSKTARVTGNTKAIKDTLKKDGFSWNAEQCRWFQTFSDAHCEMLLNESTREATLASFRMRYKGCQVSIGGVVVFTSKSFAAPAAPNAAFADRDIYNCDAMGNYCPDKQIPGSAPGDCG